MRRSVVKTRSVRGEKGVTETSRRMRDSGAAVPRHRPFGRGLSPAGWNDGLFYGKPLLRPALRDGAVQSATPNTAHRTHPGALAQFGVQYRIWKKMTDRSLQRPALPPNPREETEDI